MKTLIIEDERPAALRLTKLIQKAAPHADIVEVIDSVEASVKWLNHFEQPDLIFMDIQLADGLSFDIFQQTIIKSPVIFTTAYDQYTLKAFKVNSVDYLLKPIDPDELKKALTKYEQIYHQPQQYDQSAIYQLIQNIQKKKYKERFLVKTGQQFSYVPINDIAYFYSEDKVVCAQNNNGKRHILDYTLDQLEDCLDPDAFFRINRKYITKLSAIKKINTYFNSRLKLQLLPAPNAEVIVSRERVGNFKNWLDK
ncbi:MAG: LytTR family DNA-binding domain-containing protein [Bacteroidota bacterium]